METKQLAIFLDVCKTQSFSETSRNMYITRSAIVQHINKLEKYLGVKLFHRNSHGVKLTDAGKVLIPFAQNMVDTNDSIIQTMHNFSHTITIGTIYLQKPNLITKMLNDRPKYAKKIQIKFQELNNIKQINSQIDIIEYYEITKYLDQSFNFLKLEEEPIFIALPPNHKLARKDSIDLKDLEGYTVAIEKSGVSVIGDKVKEKLEKYPQINLKSYGIYNSSFFATAQYNNYLICIAKGMGIDTTPYVLRPLNVSEKALYGIYYRKKPNNLVKEFIKNFSEKKTVQ